MHPGWIIAAGGLVVVGGAAFVAYRNQKAQAQNTSACGSVQALAAAAFGFYIPPEACPAIDKGLGLVGEVLGNTERAKDDENKRLNGEVDIALDAATKRIALAVYPKKGATNAGKGLSLPDSFSTGPMLLGTVLRFKNGGVPFKGHPDFAKCVPGTNDMGAPGATQTMILATPGRVPTAPVFAKAGPELAAYFRNEATYRDMLTARPGDPTTSVALGIVAGKKYACPSGQVLIAASPVTDHTSDVLGRAILARCGVSGTSPEAPPPVATGGSQIPLGPSPGPNYVWDPVLVAWTRKRAA